MNSLAAQPALEGSWIEPGVLPLLQAYASLTAALDASIDPSLLKLVQLWVTWRRFEESRPERQVVKFLASASRGAEQVFGKLLDGASENVTESGSINREALARLAVRSADWYRQEIVGAKEFVGLLETMSSETAVSSEYGPYFVVPESSWGLAVISSVILSGNGVRVLSEPSFLEAASAYFRSHQRLRDVPGSQEDISRSAERAIIAVRHGLPHARIAWELLIAVGQLLPVGQRRLVEELLWENRGDHGSAAWLSFVAAQEGYLPQYVDVADIAKSLLEECLSDGEAADWRVCESLGYLLARLPMARVAMHVNTCVETMKRSSDWEAKIAATEVVSAWSRQRSGTAPRIWRAMLECSRDGVPALSVFVAARLRTLFQEQPFVLAEALPEVLGAFGDGADFDLMMLCLDSVTLDEHAAGEVERRLRSALLTQRGRSEVVFAVQDLGCNVLLFGESTDEAIAQLLRPRTRRNLTNGEIEVIDTLCRSPYALAIASHVQRLVALWYRDDCRDYDIAKSILGCFERIGMNEVSDELREDLIGVLGWRALPTFLELGDWRVRDSVARHISEWSMESRDLKGEERFRPAEPPHSVRIGLQRLAGRSFLI